MLLCPNQVSRSVDFYATAYTNNAIERLNREIRRGTRVVGTFPDGRSALMLVTARFKYVAESEWGSRRYLDVTLLEDAHREAGL